MLQGPVKIFTTSKVPRLSYVADLIMNDILGLSWEIITDKRKLGKSTVINYSEKIIRGSVKISPVSLLFETGIKNREIIVTEWKNLPVFFQTTEDSDLPFDIFAATFYLVTRYEEYPDLRPDEHGRFRAEQSLAFRHGFLGLPVINLWIKELAKALVRKYQTLSFKPNDFKQILTVDVDEPFARRGWDLAAKISGFFHDMATIGGKPVQRFEYPTKKEKNPCEVFNYLTGNIGKSNSESRFFFPVRGYKIYDKNPSWKSVEYRNLIKGIGNNFNTGLNSSFKASSDLKCVSTELKRLRSILNRQILVNRFHFLNIVLPQSYRNISKAGILEDYSMGYPEEPGFRTGIACPVMFYDIVEDKVTNLRIFPFQVMDITFTRHKRLQPYEAREIIKNMIEETKRAGGLFISIWHTTTLPDTAEGREWRKVFEFTLNSPPY